MSLDRPALEPSDELNRVIARLSELPTLAGHRLRVHSVAGGLTNRNYRVTTETGQRYIARFSGGKTSLLSIDRAAEHGNARAAAATGIGPRVADWSPQESILLVDWIDGRTFVDADLGSPEQLARVAAACRTLHSGPRFGNDFDMFAVQAGYLRIVGEHGFRLPPGYGDFAPQVQALARVLRGGPTVPCHNDLLAANIMDDGRRLWLIDFEYSGNNDPCFELGNIWSEADLEPGLLEVLVEAYYGRVSRALIARARLFGLMSKYGWTLWASIQDAVGEVDFDFWSWGMDKYARAVAEFRGPEFTRLLDEVARSD